MPKDPLLNSCAFGTVNAFYNTMPQCIPKNAISQPSSNPSNAAESNATFFSLKGTENRENQEYM
jgi:hypothetical protein